MKSRTHLLKKINSLGMNAACCALILLALTSFTGRKDDPKKGVRTVVIDAGHGGKDPGCNGVSCKEKDVALAIALKLGKLIEENCKDVKVIYTRKIDVFVELEDRAEIANKNKADLFISIHCNAAGKPIMIKDKKTGKLRAKTFKNSKGKLVVMETTNPEPYGSETYVMGLKNEEGKMKVAQRENSVILMEDNYQSKYQGFDPNSAESYIIMSNYTSAYVIQSAGLALKIQDEYAKKAGRIDKGVHRQSIWVLWRTAMPSVLTEVGYLTNPIEEKFLGSDKGQVYMAAAIFRAFRKYKDDVEGSKKNYDDELENQEALKNENTKEAQDSLKKLSGQVEHEEPEPGKDTTSTTYEAKAPETKDKPEEKKNEEPVEQPKPKEELKKEESKNVSSKDIIKNYKDKNKKDSATAPVKQVKAVEATDKSQVVFKVQFVSSDKELDVKKFGTIEDVSFYKMGAVFKYTSGHYAKIEDAVKQQAKLREQGYKDCFVAAFKEGRRIDINEARKLSGQ